MLAELEDDGRIWFVSNFAERSLVRSLPGATFSRTREQWSVNATWTACLTMRALFGDILQLGPELVKWARQQRYNQEYIRELGNALEAEPVDYYLDPRLFDYQRAGVAYLTAAEYAILGDEPGLGKTAQAIAAVKALHDCGKDVFPVLVICPNSMKRTWEDEFKLWWPDGPDAAVIHGSAVHRRKQLATDARIHVINWESVRLHSSTAGYGSIRLKACASCGGQENPREDEEYKAAVTEAKCEKHPRELNLNGYTTVIVDEAHRMKDPHAKQTRAVWSVLHSAEYRYALTGTPIADNVGDLWSILHGIDSAAFPVRSKFLDSFATTRLNFFGGYEVLGLQPARASTFHDILDLYLRRTPKSIALPQLPPKLPVQYRYAEMSPKQAKQYKQMKEGFITLLDSGEPLAAGDGLTQFTRLRQAACATLTKGDDDKVQLIDPSCKVDDLAEYIDDNPGQIVVAAKYRQVIELAHKRLTDKGLKCGLITGKQTLDERQVTVRDFQDGKLDVVLMTMAAGGVGITLTAADTIYFLERGSTLENTQAEDRVYRIGSERHSAIHVIVSVTQDTIEDNKEYQLAEQSGRLEEIVQDKERVRRMLKLWKVQTRFLTTSRLSLRFTLRQTSTSIFSLCYAITETLATQRE